MHHDKWAVRFTQDFGFEALYATAPSNRHASNWDQTGGERGIRTPDTVPRIPVFKTGAFNRSATSPQLLQFYYSLQFLSEGRLTSLLRFQSLTSGHTSGTWVFKTTRPPLRMCALTERGYFVIEE